MGKYGEKLVTLRKSETRVTLTTQLRQSGCVAITHVHCYPREHPVSIVPYCQVCLVIICALVSEFVVNHEKNGEKPVTLRKSETKVTLILAQNFFFHFFFKCSKKG